MPPFKSKHEQQDEIARKAAALLHTGKEAVVRDAVERAADRLGYAETPRPSTGLVRKHARAIAMQELGDAGYAEAIRDVWRVAEDLMTALAVALPDDSTLLVGRAARGQIDAGVTLNIRLYTDTPIGVIANALVEIGYGEPVIETVDTRFGRANRLRFTEHGHDIILTRCLKRWRGESNLNLFTGKYIESLTLTALRQRINEADRNGTGAVSD